MLPRMLSKYFKILLLTVLACVSVPSQAKVKRVETTSREDVLHGKEFGAAGAYERITGRIYFSVAIANPHNRAIVDLEKAENLKDGEVEFWSDFIAIRPKDASKGNGSLLLEIPNRGRPRIIGLVDGGDWNIANDAGDAWLLRNGFTIVMLGWQWDASGEGALRLHAPVAKDGGKTITGLVRGDVMPAKAMAEIPLGHLIVGNIGGTEYAVADAKDPRNVLTVRDSRDAERSVIPRSEWEFAQTVDGKLTPSDRHIHLNGGFQPGKLYEYVYVAADPVIAGLGFAAARDFASYAKHERDAIAPAQRVYGEGISQNGRYLRNFLYEGFNADEEGHMALDGVLAHVAGAGHGSFNYRFAQPSRDAQPTSSVNFPTDIFPFTDLPETDPITNERGGLLDRASKEKVVPKIFFSNTSYEYWGRAASLIHTSADGKKDVPLSPNVRVYHLTGLQHFSGPFPPARGSGDLLGQQPESHLPVRYFWRAMIANMDAWVRTDTLPPASSYPRIADRTLVPMDKYAFPDIPGVNRPHEANAGTRLDFGAGWKKGILQLQPPKVGVPFPVLVPQVDADGNERDGVRLPEITVPLATYASWNLRDPSIGAADQRVAFEGSYIPFPKTAAEREKSGDPRKSIAERYGSRAEYLNEYANALDGLIQQRWLLAEDRTGFLKLGEQEWEEATKQVATNAGRDPAEPGQGAPTPKLLPRPEGAISRDAIDERAMQELIHELVGCGTRLSISSWSDANRGIGCARDHVVARLNKIAAESGGKLQVVVDKFETTSERTEGKPVPMENVYAILPGNDLALAKTVFLVSGHMDSRPSQIMDTTADAPGADDDASGTAVSVESARLLSQWAAKNPGALRATLIFAVVSGEEQGLLGSKHMLDWLKEKGYSVGGMLDDDIVGADMAPGGVHRVRLFSGVGEVDDGDSASRELARAIEEIDGQDAIRMIFRVDRYGRGGDHYYFYKAGLPAVRFTEPLEDYHHEHQTPRVEDGIEYGDLEKFLNFQFLGDVARDNAEALRQLAMAPAPPTKAILQGAVTPDARISWVADEDASRAGFEVLWRETTDPRWHVYDFAVGKPELVLTGVSTDNHFFAVRSVGKNGARSLAVPAKAD